MSLFTFEISDMNPTFIFVDGSYYCFYRYFALLQWWKNAYPEQPLEDPFQNHIFVDKFKKTFVENLKQIPKKLKIEKIVKPIMIIGKDCKRENIWRNTLFSKYKANRTNKIEDGFMGGPFFKMAYEEKLFEQGGSKAILKHPKLEADDCIAISVKHVLEMYPKCTIYIITSDHDYLQLQTPNVTIYTCAFKTLKTTGNTKLDLWIKILMGDTSDNIPSVFPKCGPKTAKKCYENKDFFEKKMNNNKEYYKQYEVNKKLIDFNNIPINLLNEFMETIKK
jgi:5'-3' exonuclease